MNSDRILLLTASPPGEMGVGQLFLDSICQMSGHTYGIAALLQRNEEYSLPHYLSDSPLIKLERRYETAFKPLGNSLGIFTSSVAIETLLKSHVQTLRRKVVAFARQYKASAIFSVLECPTSILMTYLLARQLGLPLFTLVWDMPEYLLPKLGYIDAGFNAIYRSFRQAIQHSTRVAVMSRNMQCCLQQTYGVDPTILHQPISSSWQLSDDLQQTGTRNENEIVIGYAGSVTAKQEMHALLYALDSINWCLEGHPVRLKVSGLRFVFQSSNAQRIEYCGYLPTTRQVVAELASCHILFLPQPFSQSLQAFSQYSFPTKTVTYLAAKRPIFVLAPKNSTLSLFFNEHNLPIVCNTLDKESILARLSVFACDHKQRQKIEGQLQEIAQNAFSEELCQQRIKTLFAGLSPTNAGLNTLKCTFNV